MTDEKIQEEKKSSYFDNNEFIIFEKDEIADQKSLVFDADEINTKEEIQTYVSYADNILKDIDGQKKPPKQNSKIKQIALITLGATMTFLGFFYMVKNTMHQINVFYYFDRKEDIFQEADIYSIYGMSEYTDGCHIVTEGIYCNPEDPVLCGWMEFDSTLYPDAIENVQLGVHVYEGEDLIEQDNYYVEYLPSPQTENLFGYEIHIPKETWLTYGGLCVEYDKVVATDKADNTTVIELSDCMMNQYMSSRYFSEDKIKYYDDTFSHGKYDYHLNTVEFGVKNTIVEISYEYEGDESERQREKWEKDVIKTAQNAYIIVDGKKMYPEGLCSNVESSDSNENKNEWLITFGQVDYFAEEVQLVIGNARYILK